MGGGWSANSTIADAFAEDADAGADDVLGIA